MSSAETARAQQPAQAILQMLNAEWIAQGIAVVATLGVADVLGKGPKNVEEIASATLAHADSLYRLLRALATVGLFSETENKRFALTPLSDCLRSDAPNSMREAARMRNMPLFQRSWGELLHSVKTGETGLKRAFGLSSPWGYFSEHPDDSRIFDDAMTQMSRNVGSAVAEAYDFNRFRTIVDAGGGHGILLITILRRHEAPRGIVFDLAHVVKGAEGPIAEAGLAGRCEVKTGDFFESVPAGADAYLMKAIIHAFDDERASAILKNIRKVIAPNGRLLIVEHVVPEGNQPSVGKLNDLQMLVMTGGRERTRKEFDQLFAGAGFKLTAVHATAVAQSIVEGIPA